MITLLNENHVENIMEYVENSSSSENGFINEELFNDIITLRRLLFSNKLICIADVSENGDIKKLVAFAVPGDDTVDVSLYVACIYYDAPFFSEAMRILKEIIQELKYKKIKLILLMLEQNHELDEILNKMGLLLEIVIPGKCVNKYFYTKNLYG